MMEAGFCCRMTEGVFLIGEGGESRFRSLGLTAGDHGGSQTFNKQLLPGVVWSLIERRGLVRPRVHICNSRTGLIWSQYYRIHYRDPILCMSHWIDRNRM